LYLRFVIDLKYPLKLLKYQKNHLNLKLLKSVNYLRYLQ